MLLTVDDYAKCFLSYEGLYLMGFCLSVREDLLKLLKLGLCKRNLRYIIKILPSTFRVISLQEFSSNQTDVHTHVAHIDLKKISL
jgi:hypothetical protein